MSSSLLVLNSLLFGLGSWVAITGLWLETPVLIHHLPEGWSLASYLTFAIQLANIVPLIYWGLNRKYAKYCNEVLATNLQLFIGVVSSIVLIFYWDIKADVFGGSHSVVLLACAFLLSIVDCLSSVTFLPFMARFRSVYLTPYLIGEGLSGFLPTILAIAQNVEDQYNPPDDAYNSTGIVNENLTKVVFGPEIFFISLLITLATSWFAFFYLQLHQPNRNEAQNLTILQGQTRSLGTVFKKYILGYDEEQRKKEALNSDSNEITNEEHNLLKQNSENQDDALVLLMNRNRKNRKSDREKLEYYYLQFLILFACTITFGLLPPLQPFSCLPVSHSTLKYTVILSGLSYPVGCSIALFSKCKSIKILTLLSLLAAAICVFIFYSALHSPNLPPILRTQFTDVEKSVGDFSILEHTLLYYNRNQSLITSVFMISCWTAFNLILSYVKTMVTVVWNDKNGQQALFYVGLFSQFGNLLGSGLMFVAVNHLRWFKQK